MDATHTLTTTAADLKARLDALQQERLETGFYGLDTNAAYMADLLEEIEHTRIAYVGQAVTEIASLRGELGGRLEG